MRCQLENSQYRIQENDIRDACNCEQTHSGRNYREDTLLKKYSCEDYSSNKPKMVIRVIALLAAFVTAQANVIQVDYTQGDDATSLLPNSNLGVNDFPDETQINNAKVQLRNSVVDIAEVFDASKCAKCKAGYTLEKGSHGGVISCTCVKAEFFHDDMKLSDITQPIVSKIFDGDDASSDLVRGLTNQKRLYWPATNNQVIVPYEMSNSFKYAQDVRKAIAEYTKRTCIRFTPRNGERDYITIDDRSGCWAYVGKNGGRQEVSIGQGCNHIGVIEHELMHVLGFFHEHSRPDRDSYVSINFNSIVKNFESNFEKMQNIDSMGSMYDIGSVMHYGEYAFSTDGQKTILVKNNPNNLKVGQRDGFSQSDIEQINARYCGGTIGGGSTTPTTTSTTLSTTRSTTTASPNSDCRNLESEENCQFWRDQGYCTHTFTNFMKQNCKKQCKFCTATGVCKDTVRGCYSYVKYCKGEYEAWMTKNCAKTCKACLSSETTTRYTTTTTVAPEIVNDPKCGKPHFQPHNSNVLARIVGGDAAVPGSIPWQASIRYGSSSLCGGSWIGGKWILTAAHCVKDSLKAFYKVYMGLHDRDPKKGDDHHDTYSVARVIRHPGYNKKSVVNDIALIKLDREVVSTNYIIPVCLPDADYRIADGEHVQVSGWGDTKEDTVGSEVLMEVDLQMINIDTCKDWMRSVGTLRAGMMCAGYSAGGKDACQGDSGGPLTKEIDGRTIQVGVVSWGVGCARPQRPGIYSSVSHFRNWIIDAKESG